jgi:hypothetical protein
MNYRFAYAVGFHPCEEAGGDPPFAEKRPSDSCG